MVKKQVTFSETALALLTKFAGTRKRGPLLEKLLIEHDERVSGIGEMGRIEKRLDRLEERLAMPGPLCPA